MAKLKGNFLKPPSSSELLSSFIVGNLFRRSKSEIRFLSLLRLFVVLSFTKREIKNEKR